MIRKPKIEEIELIAQYNRDAAIEAWNNPLDYNKSLGWVKYVIKNPESWFFLVFEKYDKIISMVLVTYEWSDWRSANWYLIQSVYTIPEYRQQWYFKSLLNEIKLISN